MTSHGFAGRTAIAGIGATEFSKSSGRSELRLALEACDAARQAVLRKIPSPDDVAEAVLFLASPRSAGITGVQLDVNAGLWIG